MRQTRDVETRTVQYQNGRCEVVLLESVQRPSGNDNPLATESSIMWLEPIERLQFVRVMFARNCNGPRGAIVTKGKGRVIGYAKLRDDAPTDPVTGRYVRRVFFLKDTEFDRLGSEVSRIPDGVVDPRTIMPGVKGEPPDARSDRSSISVKTQQVKSKASDASLDDEVLEWLNDSIAPSLSPTRRLVSESQSQIETELAHDVPDADRIHTPGLIGSSFYGNLVSVSGGTKISLTKRHLTVGRNHKCDIVLEFATVSSLHCELMLEHGYWFVTDLNSTNGVRMDGEPIVPQERTRIEPRSVLSIGKLQFNIQYSPGLHDQTEQKGKARDYSQLDELRLPFVRHD